MRWHGVSENCQPKGGRHRGCDVPSRRSTQRQRKAEGERALSWRGGRGIVEWLSGPHAATVDETRAAGFCWGGGRKERPTPKSQSKKSLQMPFWQEKEKSMFV